MNFNRNTILINDLALNMSIGIHEHEKTAHQRVLVNIELSVSYEKTAHIDDVVSYESIVLGVQSLANARHFNLVEEFAEEIAVLCLKNKRTTHAMVSIEKPDIFKNVGSVGIRIERN